MIKKRKKKKEKNDERGKEGKGSELNVALLPNR